MQPPTAAPIPRPDDRAPDPGPRPASAEQPARSDPDPALGGVAAPGPSVLEPEVLAAAATILSLSRLIRPSPARGIVAAEGTAAPAHGAVARAPGTATPAPGRTGATQEPAAAVPPPGPGPASNGPQTEAEGAAADTVRRAARDAGHGTPVAPGGGGPAPPPLFSYPATATARPEAGLAPERGPAAGGPGVAPAEPPALPRGDHVVIRFTGDHGLEGTVRVAVRGHTIHATILSADPAAAQQMRDQLGLLRQSLESHGFPDARLAIHSLGAGDGTSAPPPAARDREPRPWREPEPRHQGQDQEAARRFRRDPHDLPEDRQEVS
jgi:hypothetical protein